LAHSARDGIDAGDEPFAVGFHEFSFEVLAIRLGLAAQARDGVEIDAGVGGFGTDDDVDFVEGDRAVEPRAGGEDGLLKFGLTLDRFVHLRDAFAVDINIRREEGEGFVKAGHAREISFAGFARQRFGEFFHLLANGFFGRGMGPSPKKITGRGERQEDDDLEEPLHELEKHFANELVIEFVEKLGDLAIIAEEKILMWLQCFRAAITGVSLGSVGFFQMFSVDEYFPAAMDGNGLAWQADDAFEDERVVFIGMKRDDVTAFGGVAFVSETVQNLDLAVVEVRFHALAAHTDADQNELEQNNDEDDPDNRAEERIERVASDDQADVPGVTGFLFGRVHALF
jgi:hypothetical protein